MIDNLRAVNGMARWTQAEEWNLDAREKLYSVVDEFTEMIKAMEKNGRKDAGKELVRTAIEDHLAGKSNVQEFRGVVEYILSDNDSMPAWKTEALRGLEKLITQNRIKDLEMEVPTCCAKCIGPNRELTSLSYIVLRRFSEYISKDSKMLKAYVGSIENVLKNADHRVSVDEHIALPALDVAFSIASQSPFAVAFIKN